MRKQRQGIFLGFVVSCLFIGCQLDSACDEDESVEYGLCVPIPEGDGDGDGTGGVMGDGDGDGDAGGAGGAGGDANGDGDAPVEEANFGADCTEGGDECKGGLICAAPQLPYCTQVSCAEGEANEGVCPSNMTCIPTGQEPPSICLK